MRNHHPWWAMIMYFPQDTPVELGPTGVMPGTQNYDSRIFESDETEGEALASGKAGTFALIHYDIWHRSTPNLKGANRFMLKFEFMRTQAPQAPSWDNREKEWVSPAAFHVPIIQHDALWKETWNWLSGRVGSLAGTESADAGRLQELTAGIEDSFEPHAINAAYELAGCGEQGISVLLDKLNNGGKKVSKLAAYGLSAAGPDAVPGLIEALRSEREETVNHAAFALGELRDAAAPAVPALVSLLDLPSVEVRRTVTESLGMIATPAEDVTAALIRCLQDEDVQVRFTAGLSLIRVGRAAEAAVPALEAALDDENRYVSAHAAEALRYIGTEEAKDALIQHLFKARWCPATTPASTFYP
ncbi:HEAT repeat domain-containing protein [Paenibacillus sp. CC-CFT747]|nr:HEAT repeat domain-containing protein [Paenibacillus sp. CC-CFT747]